MKTHLNLLFAVTAGLSFAINAETTLVYELVDSQGAAKEQTYTLHGRWVRVNNSNENETAENYFLLDSGFMIMHVVDDEKGEFFTFGESPHHQSRTVPKTPAADATTKQLTEKKADKSVLKPTGKKDTVAGVQCRVVNEVLNDKPVAEHCMADVVALQMTPRELITMARLIEFSKEWTDPDWIAAQSDEKYVSIRSRPVDGDANFILKSVSHELPPVDYFRIPPAYKKLDSDTDYAGLMTGTQSTD